MTKRPKLIIPIQPIDKAILSCNIIALVAFVTTCGYYYNLLPEEIPTHYDFSGKPDAYGDKSSIFLLPIIAIITTIPMLIIAKKPHLFNYSVEITPENALEQYTKASRLISSLALICTLIFFIIEIQTIRTALGETEGLGKSFIYIFLIIMGIPLFIYFLSLKKSTK